MKIHNPSQEPSSEQEKDLQAFFNDVVDLCNRYRVTFSIKNIFILKNESVDGKLLDVAGFFYDKDKEITYPVYVDRLSK